MKNSTTTTKTQGEFEFMRTKELMKEYTECIWAIQYCMNEEQFENLQAYKEKLKVQMKFYYDMYKAKANNA